MDSFNCLPIDFDVKEFSNSVDDYEMINEFLKKEAVPSAHKNIFQTFVVHDDGNIIAFFSLCTGSRRVFKSFKKRKKQQNYEIPNIGRNSELPTVELIWFAITVDEIKTKILH